MNADLAARAESIFLAAIELPADAREAMLRERCGVSVDGADPDADALLAEVRSLLAHHAEATGTGAAFLDSGALRRLADSAHAASLPAGSRVGRYTIIRLLGAGGMGEVYLAEQDRPRRTVALKVIRRFLGDPGGNQALRRFEAEAELLGRLHHPGIAQIFEAGAADYGFGLQPFIAMEVVQGPALLDYCKAAGLSVRDRLALMARVCDAVEHAHQRGVIHRDLKPANILVAASAGAEPQPKVLDFGVARAVSADLASGVTTLQTNAGQLVGTLPYMSPEQVGGDPAEVDTRSDVYALGVILYTALAGRMPLDLKGKSLVEAARMIREETPPLLGMVAGAPASLRGEISTIAAKAMDKDKARRYGSAAALASDIRAHLAGRPIAAEADSAWYVLRKQISRHRGSVAVATAFLVLLASFAVYAGVESSRNRRLAVTAQQARVAAERARDAADAERVRADAEAERLRRGLYFSNIGFAQAAYLNHDIERMESLLGQCPEDLRGWEWGYLAGLTDDSDYTIQATGLNSVPATYATRADTVAIADPYGVVRCYLLPRAGQAEPKPLWESPRDTAISVRMSADGRLLLAARVGVLLALDPDTGATIRSREIKGLLSVVALSPDATRAVILIRPESAAIVDTRTFETITLGRVASQPLVAGFSPDGERIVLGGRDGDVHMVRSADGAFLGSLPGHRAEVRGVVFSPDGERAATASTDETLRVWSLDPPRLLFAAKPHTNKVTALDWSPDGRLLASGSTDTTIRLLDARTGEPLASLSGHRFTVASLRFSGDSTRLLSAGREGQIKMWSRLLEPRTPTLQTDGSPFTSAIVCPDGTVLGSGVSQATIARWDLRTRTQQPGLRFSGDGVFHLALSPDATHVAAACLDGHVRVFDLRSGRVVRTLRTPSARNHRVEFSADGRRLSAGGDFGVMLWDLDALPGDEPSVHIPPTAEGGDFHAAWLPDGDRVLIAGFDKDVRLADARTGEIVSRFRGHTDTVYSCAILSGGTRAATASEDGTIRLWDLTRPDAPSLVVTGHKAAVYWVARNPAGDRIASGGFDNSVRIWDAATGAEILRLQGHLASVGHVTFSPDGALLASACDDGTIRVWGAPR